MRSSGGPISGVLCTEVVTTTTNDFAISANVTVPEGKLTFHISTSNQFDDNIHSPRAAFGSLPKTLPATLSTPQIYEWWDPLDEVWNKFAGPLKIDFVLSEVKASSYVMTLNYNDAAPIPVSFIP